MTAITEGVNIASRALGHTNLVQLASFEKVGLEVIMKIAVPNEIIVANKLLTESQEMTMNKQYQQNEKGIMSYPTDGWRRAMFKAPLTLWRLGLGPVIGHVMLIITHTGRKSGLPRRTMVEYHMLDGVKYVPCAFGPRADWYKNITADPRVTIQTAHGTERAIAARVTDDQELLAVYDLFMRRDPPLTNWYLDSLGIQRNHDDVIAKKERINWFRFDPTDEPTPPPLETDLVWVLPLVGFGLALFWMLAQRLRKSR